MRRYIADSDLQGQQYVTAGELVALQTMTNVLNFLKIKKIDFTKVCTPPNASIILC
jgi:fatty acid synthase subunit alpha